MHTIDTAPSADTRDADALRRLEAELRSRDAMLQAVSFAAQRFLSGEPLDETVPQVLRRFGEAANISLVYMFRCEQAGGSWQVRLEHEWTAPGAPSQLDTGSMASFRMADVGLGRWEALLSAGEAIYGDVLTWYEAERPILQATGIRAMAAVPIMVSGMWWGYIGFSDLVCERDWTIGEVDALQAAAGILAAAVERRQLDEALRQQSLQDEIIQAQQAALQELSTPLLTISEGTVVMPLVGTIDSMRAQMIVETLLEGVSAQRARTAIIDITGVSVVDTQVANALVRAAQAVKLLGAQAVLTGIRPEIAQTLVGLGVDLNGLITRSTLQSGIVFAMGQG